MLQGLEHKIALAYIDDVIVYGASVDEVLQNLDMRAATYKSAVDFSEAVVGAEVEFARLQEARAWK